MKDKRTDNDLAMLEHERRNALLNDEIEKARRAFLKREKLRKRKRKDGDR